MKFALPLLLLIVTIALNACTTLANRRDLYSPSRAHGPYTDRLNHAEGDDINAHASHDRTIAH